MNCRTDKLTADQRRVINKIVAQECISAAASFELMDDIAWMYAISEELHYGRKRARRLYERYWTIRKEIQEHVRADGEAVTLEDGLRESLMEVRLKRKDIDVRAWKEELGERRMQCHFSKK